MNWVSLDAATSMAGDHEHIGPRLLTPLAQIFDAGSAVSALNEESVTEFTDRMLERRRQ